MRFSIVFPFAIIGLACANLEIPEGLVSKEDVEKIVKTKCEQNGGSDAYTNLQTASVSLKDCIQALGNVTVFHDELEEAKKTGSMDEVFGKYCAKTPQVKTCIRDFRVHLEACLDSTEKTALNTTLDIVRRLGEFLCYKDGDRLAMFIAEGGVECLNSQQEAVKNCANTTFFNKVSSEISTNSLSNFLMSSDRCGDFENLRDCVVSEMEKCSDSTPANIIEALFKFIYRNTCKNRTRRSAMLEALTSSLNEGRRYKRSDSSSSSSSDSDDKDDKKEKLSNKGCSYVDKDVKKSCSSCKCGDYGKTEKIRSNCEEIARQMKKKDDSSSSSSSSSSSEEDDKKKTKEMERVNCNLVDV